MNPLLKHGPIVGVGLVNKDFVASVECWEHDHKCEAIDYFEQVGGPVPVALSACARLSGRATACNFIGGIGDDADGEHLVQLLAADGVDASLVTRVAQTITARSLVILETVCGSRTLATFARQIPPLTLDAKQEALLATASLLHLDGRDLPASERAAEIVKENGGLVSIDFGTFRAGRERLLSMCDIILCAHNAAEGLFPGITDPCEWVRGLGKFNPVIAGVTLAASGVAIAGNSGEPICIRPFAVPHVEDTCGAGDTFHGAFLYAFQAGMEIAEAADFAQATVALRIQKRGNGPGLPHRDEVMAFLKGNAARV